jgi:tetratricopeptide (TPR) repeat protein
MGFLSSLFKKTTTEADFDAAKQERAKFLSTVSTDSESDAVNAASGLLLDQKYLECIAAYEALAAKYPHRKGDADSQIGAAHYFLGDFNKAIEFYVSARTHGADESMMDDNLWEACEALVKKGDKAAAQRYLELCPSGSYVKQAKKALS